VGGGVLGLALGEAFLTGVPLWWAPAVFGVSYGAVYLAARTAFRSFMKRRFRILTGLMNRLSGHVVGTATEGLPAGTGPGE
jgi:hypothetical protein